jgi:mercuric ion transport protein
VKNIKFKSLAITSILTAFSASLCCIAPILALLAGSSGIASPFSWLDTSRPWLIGITMFFLAFAWYQKLKPRTKEEISCSCENNEKPSFWQSKKFLGIVTMITVVMLSFPYYAAVFYPKTKLLESKNINLESTYEIKISGMTCTLCEEHVKLEIGKLSGISGLEVSYEKANVVVIFNKSTTSIEDVKSAINRTAYKIALVAKLK